jgi:hypothetical protein
MATTPTSGPVTGDELIRHRLSQLEEWRVESAATVRSTERDVDALKIESATIKGLLVELRTEQRGSDEHTRVSLARLHERLDEITTAEAREKGRDLGEKAGRSETLKLIGWSVMATIAFSAVVVGLLTLLLH